MRLPQVGTRYLIWERPFLHEDFEGVATVTKVHHGGQTIEAGQVWCIVRFDDEDQEVSRWVDPLAVKEGGE